MAVLQPDVGAKSTSYTSSDLYLMPSPGGNPTTWTVSQQQFSNAGCVAFAKDELDTQAMHQCIKAGMAAVLHS
jgi:hypothetical protein